HPRTHPRHLHRARGRSSGRARRRLARWPGQRALRFDPRLPFIGAHSGAHMTITGATRVYAHIGNPITHVRTPRLYNGLLDDLGIDVAVVPVEVAPEHLADMGPAFRGWRNLCGIGVTIPHKESMMELVDELTPMAKLCGATNVIRRDPDGRLVGGQFDGIGLTQSLLDAGHRLEGKRVLLSGGGGTARAVAFAFADSG